MKSLRSRSISQRLAGAVVALAVAAGGLVAASTAAAADDQSVPGTRPADARLTAEAAAATGGLEVVVNERGLISASSDAFGALATPSSSGSFDLSKPAGATVRGAYLAYATTGFRNTPLSQPLQLAQQPVPLDTPRPNGIASFNYFSDVTAIVKPVIDAQPPGHVSIPIAEPESPNTDGSILTVIYNDPAITDPQSVTLMFGALSTAGDQYRVHLTEPVNFGTTTRLEMGLGISYSYQGDNRQYSVVDVNGQRLTSAAGGNDDGSSRSGALITQGGEGDSVDNPADPDSLPTSGDRSDDELYDLTPFVHNGNQDIEISTSNPSNDDNVFLATFVMNPPVQSVDTGTSTLDPALQSLPVGANTSVTSYSSQGVGPAFNPKVEVVDGPNAGRTIPSSCICLFPPYRIDLFGPNDFNEGLDTLLVWTDTDGDGVQGPSEVIGTTKIRWTKPIHAVGMGDSYSSGEGNDPYDSGTDDDYGSDRNQCHRSPYAYARVQQPPGYRDSIVTYLGGSTDTQLAFIACAGATTKNIKPGGTEQYNEGGTQLDQNETDADTDLVTISIGGNDVGFSKVLEVCARGDCFDPNKKVNGLQVRQWAGQVLEDLAGKLDTLLPQIVDAAPNATVALMGYPRLFDPDSGCLTLKPWNSDERRWLNAGADRLDEIMEAAAARAGVHYVSVKDAFIGHEVCGPDSDWLYGPHLPNLPDVFHGQYVGTGSFHPNTDGQAEYADLLREHLLFALAGGATENRAGLPVNPAPRAGLTSRLSAAEEPASSTDPGDLGGLSALPVEGDASTSCLPDGLVGNGSTVHVLGEGFAPGSEVSFTWENSDVADPSPPVIATATADSRGRIDTQVTLPQDQLDNLALLAAHGTGVESQPVELVRLLGIARACDRPPYPFEGFYAPVDNLPTVNLVKAGSAIPFKFSLGGDHGLSILATGSPSSVKVSCLSGLPEDQVETTAAGSHSGLTYDPSSGRYQYVWKTDKAWAGTCRRFDLTLDDGTTHSATFSFK